MGKNQSAYTAEFREQMVDLVRAGRRPAELAKEFEPSANTIRSWVKEAGFEARRPSEPVSEDEREELRRLRRENAQLVEEREILKNHPRARPHLRTRNTRALIIDGAEGEWPSAFWWSTPLKNVAQGLLRTCHW